MNKYLVIIEKGDDSYGAYSPDLPGCIAVGDTVEEVEARMLNAMKAHLAALVEDGIPIPIPTTAATFVVALEVPTTKADAA